MTVPALILAAALAAAGPVSAQDKKVETVTEALDRHERRIDLLFDVVNDRVPTSIAILDCENGKYSHIQPTDGFAVFFARCEKVEPYLEGYRITVALGNPYFATFADMSGELGYGKDLYETNTRRQPWNVPGDLKAGSWTKVTVTLNRVEAKDLRTVVLTMKTGSMKLLNP